MWVAIISPSLFSVFKETMRSPAYHMWQCRPQDRTTLCQCNLLCPCPWEAPTMGLVPFAQRILFLNVFHTSIRYRNVLLNAHYCNILFALDIFNFCRDHSLQWWHISSFFTGAWLTGPFLHMYWGQLTRGSRPEGSASSECHVWANADSQTQYVHFRRARERTAEKIQHLGPHADEQLQTQGTYDRGVSQGYVCLSPVSVQDSGCIS